MAAQPQAQIRTAITAAQAALKAEPEMADKSTLSHAINLLQRVYDKNQTETGQPVDKTEAKFPDKNASYTSIANKHILQSQAKAKG